MMHLLKLEWLKYKSNVVFQVMIILFTICMGSLILIGKEFKEVPPPLPDNTVFFRFPSVWDYQAYIGNWLVFFFIGVLVVYMTANEFRNKTLRQNIITGLTRTDLFMAKLLMGITLCLYATLVYIISSLLYGIFNTPDFAWELIFENMIMIPKFLLMSFGYVIFGLLMGILFRKSGLSMFMYLIYIMFIELILRWGVHYQLWEHKSFRYYPMNAVEDLAPNPIGKLVENFQLPFDLFLSPQEAVITSSVYIVLFIWVTYRLFVKGNM